MIAEKKIDGFGVKHNSFTPKYLKRDVMLKKKKKKKNKKFLYIF